MRALRASKEPEAAAAIELFVYRIVLEIGTMAAAAGGVDAIVFTGGIGQNDAEMRASIAKGCEWLGLKLDQHLNAAAMTRIDGEGSTVAAFVIATDEEQMIARHTSALLGSPQAVVQGTRT
jgi:acetate kinase